jgi:hypothetical protein
MFEVNGVRRISVQDIISQQVFEKDQSGQNDMLDLLKFAKDNAVSLSESQAKAIFLLNEFGLNDIAEFAVGIKPLLTQERSYLDIINKITLADRIKGTAKLGNILKAQVANPSNNVPSANEVQPKAMRERDLR